MARTAHDDAVRMLARRDLSQQQVRQRLSRLGHGEEAIASAVASLIERGAIDDRRTAGAIARLETTRRGRGSLRVRQRLAAAGIGGDVVQRALDEAFADVDEDLLLSAALDRRLAGAALPADERGRARLYRHLIGQGFARERVLQLLRARGRNTDT